VQSWFDEISRSKALGRNTCKRVKSTLSGAFRLAIQQDYFDGTNPVREASTNSKAPEPAETHAYDLAEIAQILAVLPEPAATAFAVAAFAGLRRCELEGLRWADFRDGEIHVSRSIWNGIVGPVKTRRSMGSIPVIRQLAERLELHRLRTGNPQTGPIFANGKGKPLSLVALAARVIVPALKGHDLEWRGWHAARRGLGSNLYRLGAQDKVIQKILRHASVSTTTNFYIKSGDADARNEMSKLENAVQDSYGTVNAEQSSAKSTIQ
jgi:integrase